VAEQPSRLRLAEIYISDADGMDRRGTGYLVRAGWVLTAAHVLYGAATIEIWFGAPLDPRAEDGVRVDASSVLLSRGAEDMRPDLALLPVPADDIEPVLFGHLSRDVSERVPAVAVGFPRFKLRPAAAPGSRLLREVHYATGAIVAGADAKKGQLAFTVTEAPGADPDPQHSPWEGMSGAAVWAGGRLIGVVAEHHPGDSPAGLTIEPLEQLFLSASERHQSAWRNALPQLPAGADGLWMATPPTPTQLADRQAQRTAHSLAPEVLIAREGELATLTRFSTSQDRWCWIKAGPFAGKTALLAWFVLHPPDGVDVVACFLRRAATTDTPDYALGVLNRQLAALATGAEYRSSEYVAERAEDFRELVADAARASAERDRRLLLVIDGLDEYEAHPFGLDQWLPDSATMPANTSVLVSSRTGAHVGLAAHHPLHGAVRSIDASDAARGIQERAQLEIESAAADSTGIAHPIIGFLAAADAGLTASELAELLRRYGRATDAADVQRTLQTSLGRSVRQSESPLGRDRREPVQVFSHESLLTAASRMFADARTQYLSLLDAWADSYRDQRWPASVPQYLLTPYLRHLTTKSLEPGPPEVGSRARERLAALCSDPGWLHRTITDAGVDAGIDALAGAQASLRDDWLDAITRSLRRSRVALAADPDQLATQLHGRLGRESDQRLRAYVSRLPSIAPTPWVKLRGTALGWRADLETMFTYHAKVRAVAFGRVGSRVVLAVGAGEQMVVRDLQRGADAQWVIDNDGLRVTATAMGTVEGREVVVAVARYDATVAVRDVRTGQLVGAAMAGAAESVAVGSLEGSSMVAGVEGGRLRLWEVATGQPIEAGAPAVEDRQVVGVGTVNGRLVAHVMEHGDAAPWRLVTISLEDGTEAAPPVTLSRRPDLVASWAYPDGIAVVSRDDAWRIADHVTAGGPLQPVRSIDGDERVRAIAIARVADRYVVTAAPDNDLDVGFVSITELTARSDAPPDLRSRPVVPRGTEAVLITAEDTVQLLTPDPVTLVDADTGDVLDPQPTPELVARALTGQPAGRFIQLTADGAVHFKEPQSAARVPEENHRRAQRLTSTIVSDLSRLSLRADQHDSWPTLARAFGVIEGNAVIARGSYNGAVWVEDLASGDTIAGPFVKLPPTSTIFLAGKPSPRKVASVAVGEFNGLSLVAAAFEDRAWVAQLGDPGPAPTVIRASSVVAVALGQIAGQIVIITGSRGGFVGAWRVDTGEQVTGFTLDSGVERVWVVHEAETIAAQTDDHAFVIADVVQ
jgi:hypothetical protein